MKVLMVHKFYYPGGGSDTAMFQTKLLLEQHGHAVIPFAMHHPSNLPCEFSKHFVSHLDFSRIGGGLRHRCRVLLRMLYSVEARRRIRSLIEQQKPDVAHIHNVYHQISPSVLPLLKEHGVPMVMTAHDYKLVCPSMLFLRGDGRLGCDDCRGRYFYHAVRYKCIKDSYLASTACAAEMWLHRFLKLYDLVDVVISPSWYYADKLVNYRCVEPGKVTVLPNFVRDFDPSPLDAHAPLVYVGKLTPEKGLFLLLEAVSQTSRRLLIAGDGILRNPLEEYAARVAPDNVTFLGFVSNSKIPELLSNASALVLPSLHQESCPMVILEAYTGGRPVVASRVGGVPEFVEDRVTGLLTEPGSSVALAKAIARLYSSPRGLLDMGTNARHKVEREYSPDRHYDRLMQIYAQAARQVGSGRGAS